jgi:hypothetical protein
VAARAAVRHAECMKMRSSAVWLIVPGEGIRFAFLTSAKREASMENTAPIDALQTLATNFWKPGRTTTPDPDRPRSSSIVVTDAKPMRLAVSASAY